MNILIIHQNFPGQFKYLAAGLVARGHNVVAMAIRQGPPEKWMGVSVVPYQLNRINADDTHPWLRQTETNIIFGESCFRACMKLKTQEFNPEVIIAHPGWGESLFLKEIWPRAKLGIYCEFYYSSSGADIGFDPELSRFDDAEPCRLRLKNTNNLLNFEIADAGISPTKWQASTFPEYFRNKIKIIHDGINSDNIAPNHDAQLILNNGLQFSRKDKVITFVNRNLEPYRGYHIFMRSLPEVLKRHPQSWVLIVGGNGVSYGAPSPDGRSWRDIFIAEVRPQISDSAWRRVIFLGQVPYEHFISLLQLSTVHVYLTYPFILSWSLLEAMSVGCAIVASDTKPVQEVIRHNDTGRLVGFFDIKKLANEICGLLDDRMLRHKLGTNARESIKKTYDLKTVCLPKQIKWVEALGRRSNAHPVLFNS